MTEFRTRRVEVPAALVRRARAVCAGQVTHPESIAAVVDALDLILADHGLEPDQPYRRATPATKHLTPTPRRTP